MFVGRAISVSRKVFGKKLFSEVAGEASQAAKKVEKVIGEKVEQVAKKDIPKKVSKNPNEKVTANQQPNVAAKPSSKKSSKKASTSSKVKKYTYWTLGLAGGKFSISLFICIIPSLVGAVGYSYHLRNDAYAQMTLEATNPQVMAVLRSLRIAPLSFKMDDNQYEFDSYIDRLASTLYEDGPNYKAPRPFGTLGNLKDFLKKFTTIPEDDFNDNSVLTKELMVDYLNSISRFTPNIYIYILGERLYNVSPMTEFVQQETEYYFHIKSKMMNNQECICIDDLAVLLADVESLSHSEFDMSPFKKNFCNTIFRSISPIPEGSLLTALKNRKGEYITKTEYYNYMAIACRHLNKQETLMVAVDSAVEYALEHKEDVIEEEVKEEIPVEVEVKEEIPVDEVKDSISEVVVPPVEIEEQPKETIEESAETVEEPKELEPVVIPNPVPANYWGFKAAAPIQGWTFGTKN
ncbi:hypothetical protein WA158_003939 [Blastocystis sp. Blastoise]